MIEFQSIMYAPAEGNGEERSTKKTIDDRKRLECRTK